MASRGGIGAGAADDLAAPARGLHRQLDDAGVLRVIQRGGFAGGPDRDDAGDPALDLPLDQARKRGFIERALPEGGDDGCAAAPDTAAPDTAAPDTAAPDKAPRDTTAPVLASPVRAGTVGTAPVDLNTARTSLAEIGKATELSPSFQTDMQTLRQERKRLDYRLRRLLKPTSQSRPFSTTHILRQ